MLAVVIHTFVHFLVGAKFTQVVSKYVIHIGIILLPYYKKPFCSISKSSDMENKNLLCFI